MASVSRSTREFMARAYSSRCFLLDQAEPGAPKSTLGLPVVLLPLLVLVLEPECCAEVGENELEEVPAVGWLFEGVVSAGGESGASIMGESADSCREEREWDRSLLRCAKL